jgi:hypothetical protein
MGWFFLAPIVIAVPLKFWWHGVFRRLAGAAVEVLILNDTIVVGGVPVAQWDFDKLRRLRIVGEGAEAALRFEYKVLVSGGDTGTEFLDDRTCTVPMPAEQAASVIESFRRRDVLGVLLPD